MINYAKDQETNKSLQHSLRDAVAYSVMTGSGETYLSAFAVFLKATTAQIGLLASLPPLIGSFAQLLSAWLGRRTRKRKSVILLGAYLQAASWLPIIILPMLYHENAVSILVGCVVVYYFAGNLVIPQWSSLMGDLVPERRRGRFFARRTGLASITTFVALVSAGTVLNFFATHHNTFLGYIIVFGVAAVARFVSTYHLNKMSDPPGKVAKLEVPTNEKWITRIRGSSFVRFAIFFSLMQFAVAIASPFFTVFMLRELKFTYFEFMVNTATSVLFQFITLNTWGRISDIFGNRRILLLTGFVIPIIPTLWLISHNFWYLLLVQALSGISWAGYSLSAGNFLYELIPATKRATYLAFHNVLANSGTFFGAMLGGYLGTVLPSQLTFAGMTLQWTGVLSGVFLLSGIARITVAGLFLPRLREVRSVRAISVTGLIFRVARFNALSGLIFDIVGSRRRKSDSSIPYKEN